MASTWRPLLHDDDGSRRVTSGSKQQHRTRAASIGHRRAGACSRAKFEEAAADASPCVYCTLFIYSLGVASAGQRARKGRPCWLSKSKAHGQVGPLKGFPASMSPGQVAECLSTISRRPSLVVDVAARMSDFSPATYI